MERFLKPIRGSILIASAIAVGFFIGFLAQPLLIIQQPLVIKVSRGQSVRRVVIQLQQQGQLRYPYAFIILSKLTGAERHLQAGYYRLHPQQKPIAVIQQLHHGDVMIEQMRITEGWTVRDMHTALKQAPYLQHVSMPALQEGRYFPDTYQYRAGDDVTVVLQAAQERLQRHLQQLWPTRAKDLPYQTPYQALIAASIIEKETALDNERTIIAGIIVNRLQRHMRLQMDPTVIYGLGKDYHGKLTKRDLRRQTPYNTYRIKGLPPTPICLPSLASIKAALRPAKTDYLYFVANKDGGHTFSKTLEQQIKAIHRIED